MLLLKILIFSPGIFTSFIYFTELDFNSSYNSQHSSQKRIERATISSSYFHLSCETKTELKKNWSNVHNNTVTRWLFAAGWTCTLLQRCTVGDDDVLGAVRDQDLAWTWWQDKDELRILWAPSVHFLVNANMCGVKVGKEDLQSREKEVKSIPTRLEAPQPGPVTKQSVHPYSKEAISTLMNDHVTLRPLLNSVASQLVSELSGKWSLVAAMDSEHIQTDMMEESETERLIIPLIYSSSFLLCAVFFVVVLKAEHSL